jgi:flagellar biosynthetic protein FliR
MTDSAMEGFAALLALALVRYIPPVVLPSLSPLRWAPALVRIVLALALAWLTVLSAPLAAPHAPGMAGWILAAAGEFAVGLAFGLAFAIPQAALHTMGWLADIQAGLGAATLFDPGGQGDAQSLLGTALMLLATSLFFLLDLHLDLYRALAASARVLPVGHVRLHADPAALLGLLGSAFVLALAVVAPVVVGLFAVDAGVAYATRSMPQANVYFLALPLKVAMALLLLAATLPYVPALLARLFRDALVRVPALLGA